MAAPIQVRPAQPGTTPKNKIPTGINNRPAGRNPNAGAPPGARAPTQNNARKPLPKTPAKKKLTVKGGTKPKVVSGTQQTTGTGTTTAAAATAAPAASSGGTTTTSTGDTGDTSTTPATTSTGSSILSDLSSYEKPLIIGAVLVGAFLLYRKYGKKKAPPPPQGVRK